MNLNELHVGQIVTVTHRDLLHLECQGRIVKIDPTDAHPVSVWFGRESDLSADVQFIVRRGKLQDTFPLNVPESEEEIRLCARVALFEPEVLRVDQEWRVMTLAQRYFPRMHHSVYECRKPFERGTGLCMVKDCAALQARRIIFNIHGTVVPAYVCDAHANEYHGKMGDVFPYRDDPNF